MHTLLKIFVLLVFIGLLSCKGNLFYKNIISQPTEKFLDTDSNTIVTRINCPIGFNRVFANDNTFTYYLRNFPLKPFEADVKLFDGTNKNRLCHVGVIDMEAGATDLQQCADSGIRLYAEYLYHAKQYDKIHFNFTNGQNCAYTKYAEGWRMEVNGNKTAWYKATQEDYSYKNFRKYLDLVFMYAGSYSLSKELIFIKKENIQPGDLFVHPGFPGHVEIVMDVCKNNESGEILFLLAQGFTPAQEIEVLENEVSAKRSPWYSTNEQNVASPQFTFEYSELMRFE